MALIYEEEGPIWIDSDGQEQSGWPWDGFQHELHKLGPDRFELRTTRRHVDADGERYDVTQMTAAEAETWLLERKPVPTHIIAAHVK